MIRIQSKLIQSMHALLMVLGGFFLASCEQEITVDLNSAATQLVIEGNITNAAGPYWVTITKTVNFTEVGDYPPVSGAMVIISDGQSVTDTLSEMAPGRYETHNWVGQPGHVYHLRVELDGKSYTAVSTMPVAVILDTLLFSPFAAPGSNGGFVTLPVFTDPVMSGNSYRFIQAVNGKLDATYVVFNDNANNGLVNQRPIVNPATAISAGDTVSVEMRCIDPSTYTYFYALSQTSGGGPGGGATPSNPPTNLIGDQVVGLFSAYTTQRLVQVAQ